MNTTQNARNHDELVDPLFINITKRLRHIAHKLDKHSKYLQENFNVTVPQIITLREIYEHGPISSSRLTHIVSLNASTITGIIDRLERQGLVQRTRTARDRRRIDVVITEEGISFLKRIPPPVQQSLIDGLQELSVEEIDRVLWSIETIVSLLQRDDELGPTLTTDQEDRKVT